MTYKCVKTGCFIRVETEGDVCFRCKEVQAKKLDRQSKLERGITRTLEHVAGYGADRGARLVPVRGKSTKETLDATKARFGSALRNLKDR